MPRQFNHKTTKPALKIMSFTPSGVGVEAVLEFGEKTHRVFFESDDYTIEPAREALLPLTLLVAMRHASSLQVGGEIDSVLFDHLPALQERLLTTNPAYSPIPIEAISQAPVVKTRPGRVGLFFSGGLDSWYSLLDHREEITDLVFVSGVDIPLGSPAQMDKSIDLVRRVAEHFGKNLVILRSNMRDFIDPYISWNILNDTLMQCPAHLLPKDIGKIYLAAAHTTAELVRFGLDPTLINLWSSSSLQVVSDSLEVERVVKAARVAQEEMALNNLRVCWKHPARGLNCGACEKCVRTMINLEAVGALARSPVFNRPLDLKLVARQFHKEDTVYYAEQNLAAITARQGDSPLARAIRSSIRYSARRQWFNAHFPRLSSLVVRLRQLKKRKPRSASQYHR